MLLKILIILLPFTIFCQKFLNATQQLPPRQMILLSNGGTELLSIARNHFDEILQSKNITKILLIPYASLKYDSITKRLRKLFIKWGYQLESIHEKHDSKNAINRAQAIYVCGGNTFVLLKKLYDNKLIEPIREQILLNGVPYFGSSAGANVATRSIHTTNDMPVVYPPSLYALNLVPFNLNPHYVETDPNLNHRFETRDKRLNEFMYYQNLPVIGLRDGNILLINGNQMILYGYNNLKYFINITNFKEYLPSSDLSFLLD